MTHCNPAHRDADNLASALHGPTRHRCSLFFRRFSLFRGLEAIREIASKLTKRCYIRGTQKSREARGWRHWGALVLVFFSLCRLLALYPATQGCQVATP
ncbi:hypothetical protein CGRA01v4_13261 [Colletotrichum graminicola]|nr:hypothetical protein CGRA01v4_13261 [Colletotrichum graminicola]